MDPSVAIVGEIVILVNGLSQFHMLQKRNVDNPREVALRQTIFPATLVAFDVLEVGGHDCVQDPKRIKSIEYSGWPISQKARIFSGNGRCKALRDDLNPKGRNRNHYCQYGRKNRYTRSEESLRKSPRGLNPHSSARETECDDRKRDRCPYETPLNGHRSTKQAVRALRMVREFLQTLSDSVGYRGRLLDDSPTRRAHDRLNPRVLYFNSVVGHFRVLRLGEISRQLPP